MRHENILRQTGRKWGFLWGIKWCGSFLLATDRDTGATMSEHDDILGYTKGTLLVTW